MTTSLVADAKIVRAIIFPYIVYTKMRYPKWSNFSAQLAKK